MTASFTYSPHFTHITSASLHHRCSILHMHLVPLYLLSKIEDYSFITWQPLRVILQVTSSTTNHIHTFDHKLPITSHITSNHHELTITSHITSTTFSFVVTDIDLSFISSEGHNNTNHHNSNNNHSSNNTNQ